MSKLKYTLKCETNLNHGHPWRHEHIIKQAYWGIKSNRCRELPKMLSDYILDDFANARNAVGCIHIVYDSCKTDRSHKHCKNKQLETSCWGANCRSGQILNIKSDENSLGNE